ncbi:MAG: DNA-directed polymerase subunit omega [Actinomycetota bacterium]|nr:DNA-directed RNA polymerase subunit omega [Actinomycetota bacterium]
MTTKPDNTMMSPPIENLLERTKSKFSLVTLAAKRAREITEYSGNLRMSEVVGPTVETVSTKHLSVAFEEIAADKVRFVPKTLEEIRAEIAELQRQEDEANALAASEATEAQPE